MNYDNQTQLRGRALEYPKVRGWGRLTVALPWEASAQPSNELVVLVHLASSGGDLLAQPDDAPVGSVLPQRAWPVGATSNYPVAGDLPNNLLAGTDKLVVGVHRSPDVERLPIPSEDPRVEEETIQLGHAEVVP